MKYDKPITFIDLETTGTEVKEARIVEISACKIFPDGSQDKRTKIINPEIPIPAQTTAIHGISDSDVLGNPTFKQVANSLYLFLEDTDFCGFNLLSYDLPLLYWEFNRVGIKFDYSGRNILDLKKIYHEKFPRDLSSAVREYLGVDHNSAHSASGDTLACIDLLDRMLQRHDDLPRDFEKLSKLYSTKFIDPEGVVIIDEFNRYVINRTMHKGKLLNDCPRDFLEWVVNKSKFNDIVKDFIKDWLSKN